MSLREHELGKCVTFPLKINFVTKNKSVNLISLKEVEYKYYLHCLKFIND